MAAHNKSLIFRRRLLRSRLCVVPARSCVSAGDDMKAHGLRKVFVRPESRLCCSNAKINSLQWSIRRFLPNSCHQRLVILEIKHVPASVGHTVLQLSDPACLNTPCTHILNVLLLLLLLLVKPLQRGVKLLQRDRRHTPPTCCISLASGRPNKHLEGGGRGRATCCEARTA
jgi:hypothetical protein